jgi:predicted lipoprotein with Yx(FWY)xxD motif
MRRVRTLLAIAGLSLGTGAAIAAATSVATVGTASGRLGTFLVGTNGHTLYVLSADKRNKSTCGGQCATNWPPLLTSGKPKVKGAAKSSALGTIKRGSSEQVTYNGHPLYYDLADTVAGDLAGQGTKVGGGTWTVIGPNGSPITSTGKSAPQGKY